MILGLSVALVSALGTNLSALFKARGAGVAQPVRIRHPLGSAAGLFRSRWFAIGWILSVFAWGLHVEALSLAPLSSVQAILSGGLVFLAVLAERFFGFHLGRRQYRSAADLVHDQSRQRGIQKDRKPLRLPSGSGCAVQGQAG